MTEKPTPEELAAANLPKTVEVDAEAAAKLAAEAEAEKAATKPKVDPNNKRDGLSRKEKRKLTDEQNKNLDAFEEGKKISESITKERTDELDEKLKDFDAEKQAPVKEAYEKEVARLTGLGIDAEKAHIAGLDSINGQTETLVKEAEEAAADAGRKGAKLPPKGAGTEHKQFVYTNAQLLAMPTKDALKIRKLARAGKAEIRYGE